MRRNKTRLLPCCLLTLVACATTIGKAQKFLPDDPLWKDPDQELSIPKPTERPLSKTIDLLQKTFTKPLEGSKQAQNLNTLGEVPDSSWYANRMSRRVLSIDELVRGPNQGTGPDLSKPFLVVGAKTEGVTPGLLIKDARGDLYFIKFDAVQWPQMATSTEIIGTKFFYAFGYHVPQNYLVRWNTEYEIDPEAEVLWETGHVERLTRSYVEDLLRDVPFRTDGSVQVVASKFLSGKPIGPYDFQGTRSDDPNDIFPHQDRRELRALQIFTAWMNHNDSDSVNTLDMYFTDAEGRGYVRHHLIDFGTVFGSGAHQPHARRVGNEYYIEFKPALKAAGTLGIWDRPWRKLKFQEYKSIGRFESDYFQPQHWRPDYPNPAFDKMTLQDALWATRTVMRFSDEAIRAMVAIGKIDEAAAADYLTRVLIERRDKIVRYYLGQINPIDGFTVADGEKEKTLEFTNLGLKAGLSARCEYSYQWSQFDNQTETSSPLGSSVARTGVENISIPEDPGEFLLLQVRSECSDQPNWRSEVRIYLRNGPTLEVVGIERDDPPGAGS